MTSPLHDISSIRHKVIQKHNGWWIRWQLKTPIIYLLTSLEDTSTHTSQDSTYPCPMDNSLAQHEKPMSISRPFFSFFSTQHASFSPGRCRALFSMAESAHSISTGTETTAAVRPLLRSFERRLKVRSPSSRHLP